MPIPATVWPPSHTTTDPTEPWPVHVIDQVLTAFTEPGAHVTILELTRRQPDGTDTHLEQALATTRRLGRIAHHHQLPHDPTTRPTPEPYWATLLRTELHTDADVVPAAEPTTTPADRIVDLVIATVDHTGADDRLGATAAALLRPGGILTVLTHSHPRCGRFVDPGGSTVASCQHADLLYLQHIIALHAPPQPRQPDTNQHLPGQRHTPAHSDILVFTNPATHQPNHTGQGAAQ